ncbi:MAG TPA: surface lipoprotein assembly modifier, partial [Polyangiales bacterium]|nr:surface lipoprotein assembly modifier [Polyangiales bacterium]
NAEASFVDQSISSLGSTAVWLHDGYRFSGGVDGYRAWLDGSNHERGVNLNLGASRQFGSHYEGALSLRAGTLSYYNEALSILDTNRYLAGVSLTRLDVGDRAARVGATLLWGMDDAKGAGSPYGNDRYGLRLFGSMSVLPYATAYVELSGMSTRYDGAFFGSRRHDDQLGLTLAADLQDFPARRWMLTPRLRYTKNDSNVVLYEYDRFEAVLYIRRGF